VNGLTAAKGLRRSVDQAGGVMRISVGALGDAFGRGRMTPRAKAGIEQVLRRAGVEIVPPLTVEGDGWVTLHAAAGEQPLPPATGPGGGATVFHAVAEEVRAIPRPHIPASLAAALALLVPVTVAGAVVGSEGETPRPAAAVSAPDPRVSLLDRAESAFLAGDYRQAVRLTAAADPSRVAPMRGQIVTSLLSQARTAQRGRAYVRAIRLSRRAARFGRAPGAARIVRQSRAGLDLRRETERLALGKTPGR
jgi:hypothetical protein